MHEKKDDKFIRIKPDVQESLKKHGKFGETYNDVIRRLIKIVEDVEGG